MSWFSKFFNPNKGMAEAMAAAEANRMAIWQQQQAEAERQRLEMERREQERQDNIRAGNSAIDTAFTQFNPEYFKGVQDSYSGFYLPQIDQQRTSALDKLTAQLANRGMLESSVGAQKIADLNRTADDARARVGGEAVDFSNQLRGKIDASKNTLYDLSKQAADPSMVSARATGEATNLAQTGAVAPSQPLGDLFGSILLPFAYAMNAQANSTGQRKGATNNFAPVSGAGSARVLN